MKKQRIIKQATVLYHIICLELSYWGPSFSKPEFYDHLGLFNPPVNHILVDIPSRLSSIHVSSTSEDSFFPPAPSWILLHSGSAFHCSTPTISGSNKNGATHWRGEVDIVPTFCVGSDCLLPSASAVQSRPAGPPCSQLTRGTSGEGMTVLMRPVWSNFYQHQAMIVWLQWACKVHRHTKTARPSLTSLASCLVLCNG